MPRWDTTAGVKAFFSDGMKQELQGYAGIEEFNSTLPADFNRWGHLAQAQYIEIQTLLSGNLLSSQGDRMAMAHAVEGRYPFLDYRVVEFCAQIPPRLKLKGMQEKYLLKKIAKPYLPDSITGRVKQAYRAPDSASFFKGDRPGYVEELLTEENLRRSGYFNPITVGNLVKRCRTADSASFSTKHNIAITGIITTLLLDKMFITNFNASASPERIKDIVEVA
jgi:asparagine synthase (glutamine-hydrolysing)